MNLLAFAALGLVASGKTQLLRWCVWISLSAFSLLLSGVGSYGQATPSFLAQVVTETHQGGVVAAAADRARRIVVTTGRDGTARVWSLPDLRLLRVLRPPLGDSLDGTIAVTPDGSIAAAASRKYVVIFDLTTGEIVRRIPVRSTVAVDNHLRETPINALAISPDGEQIAIGRLPEEDGCWLYLVRLDGTEVSHQCTSSSDGSPSTEETLAMSFAADGRLAVATTGRGGINKLTVLAANATVLKSISLPARVWFSGLAFSPDGQRLAVAYWGSPSTIEIREGSALALISTPDTRGLDSFLPALSWIDGGHTLIASGFHAQHGPLGRDVQVPVYAWDSYGEGRRREAFFGMYRLGSLIDLPNNLVFLVADTGGDLVVANQTGAILYQKYPEGADFGAPFFFTSPSHAANDDRLRLRVSHDGSQIELVTYDQPKRWLHVDAVHLIVAEIPGPQPGLDDWTLGGARFDRGTLEQAWFRQQEDYFESPTGRLAPGARLFDQMKAPETKRLLQVKSERNCWLLNGRGIKAISMFETYNNQPSRTSVAAGRVVTVTDDSGLQGPGVHAFDLQGKPLWTLRVASTGLITRINQSSDGRLVVIASSDGTIRWYAGATGTLVLTLFLERTDDRWIFFTPSGYYFASPGAEKYAGWLIGWGPRGPDFFSVGQFADQFSRRKVVEHILDTLDESDALRLAEVPSETTLLAGDLPPIVTITSPQDGSRITGATIPVEYTLRSPSGRGIREILVLIDGKQAHLDTTAHLVAEDRPRDEVVRGRIEVPVPPGRTFTLSVLAATDTGRHGPASAIKLLAADQTNASTPVRRRLFALIVGAQTYARLSQEWQKLHYTAQDAKSVAELLSGSQQRRIYDDVEIRLLVDGGDVAPTREAILDGLNWLRKQAVRPDDVVLLFISSHGRAGHTDVNGQKDLMILPTDADPADLEGTAIAGQKIIDTLKDIPGNILMMIDACYAGAAVQDTDRFVVSASSPWAGMFVFASSSTNELSQEDSRYGHGRFTQALLEALHGRNGMKTTDGVILTDLLASYLKRRIPQLGRMDSHQTPLFASPIYAPDLRAFAVAN